MAANIPFASVIDLNRSCIYFKEQPIHFIIDDETTFWFKSHDIWFIHGKFRIDYTYFIDTIPDIYKFELNRKTFSNFQLNGIYINEYALFGLVEHFKRFDVEFRLWFHNVLCVAINNYRLQRWDQEIPFSMFALHQPHRKQDVKKTAYPEFSYHQTNHHPLILKQGTTPYHPYVPPATSTPSTADQNETSEPLNNPFYRPNESSDQGAFSHEQEQNQPPLVCVSKSQEQDRTGMDSIHPLIRSHS